MPFYVYILQSELNGSFYKGSTDNISRRFKEHNDEKEFSTKRYSPWNLVWVGLKQSKSDAIKLEYKINVPAASSGVFVNRNLVFRTHQDAGN